MRPTLTDLIERGQQLKSNGQWQFQERQSFYEWHEACAEYLECLLLAFRENIQNPVDVEKGVNWLKSTFRES